MHVLVTSDRVGGQSPDEATRAMAEGWSTGPGRDQVVARAGSDAGPGLLDAVRFDLPNEPLGTVGSDEALLTGPSGAQTAWVQASACSGSHRVGEIVEQAVAAGAVRVVVGLGGCSWTDAGMGFLGALGVCVPAEGSVPAARDLLGVVDVRARLRGVDLVAAYDEDRVLTGMLGLPATVQHGDQGPVRAQRLQGWLTDLVIAAAGLSDPTPDVLAAGRPGSGAARLAAAPGSGAGGGLGFALGLLGARLVPGAAVVADLCGLDEAIDSADLVVVGLDVLDWDTAATGLVGEVARRASDRAVPVVVLAREVVVGRRDLADAGLVAAYPTDGADLHPFAARVARTWSPGW